MAGEDKMTLPRLAEWLQARPDCSIYTNVSMTCGITISVKVDRDAFIRDLLSRIEEYEADAEDFEMAALIYDDHICIGPT